MKRGSANGLRRYRCKACSKSFNALTGTPLARLRHKERWLDFAQALTDGDTVRASAGRCEVAVGTALRWRHRFLQALKTATAPLRGIVEADEAFVLDSRKGDRQLERPARKRGGHRAGANAHDALAAEVDDERDQGWPSTSSRRCRAVPRRTDSSATRRCS